MAEAIRTIEVGGTSAAAILMLILDDTSATAVLGALDPEEVHQIGAAMLDATDVDEQAIAQSLAAFHGVAQRCAPVVCGPRAGGRVRTLIEQSVGEDLAAPMIDRLAPVPTRRPFAALQWSDAARIAGLLEDEHPQVAAIMLTHLDPAQASQVLVLLPDALRLEVVHRVATIQRVDPAIVEELDRRFNGAILRRGGSGLSAAGGPEGAARLLARGDPGEAKRMVAALAKRDRAIARAVDDALLLFDDLANLDPKSLGVLVRSTDADVLALALVGSPARFIDALLGTLSSRAADTVRDALVEKANAPVADVDGARKTILLTARRMADAGEISLNPGGR